MARLSRTSPRGFDVGIKHIRAVNSVALYGSFTAAAADLGMTQSAVSRLVLQLEKQLGVSLFLRPTPNVVLTAPGREFTASTRRLIEDLNIQVENARALGGQIRGRLIISCLLSITHHVVPDAVLKYRKAHPGVEVHLREGCTRAFGARWPISGSAIPPASIRPSSPTKSSRNPALPFFPPSTGCA